MRQIILPEEKLHELAQLTCDRILTNRYLDHEVTRGEDLKAFAEHEQINRFLLFQIFQIWNIQTNKLRHPYFDFDNDEIQGTLRVLQNQLSQHITIKKEDFKPLLKRAIYNTLTLVLNPTELFTSFFFVNNDQISIESFEKHLAFFSDFDFIVNSIFRYHQKHNLTFVERNTFFDKMERVISLYNSKTDANIDDYRADIFNKITQQSLESVISEARQLEEEKRRRMEEEQRRKEETERKKKEAEERMRLEKEEQQRVLKEKEKAEQERLKQEKLRKANFFDSLSKEEVFFDLEEEERSLQNETHNETHFSPPKELSASELTDSIASSNTSTVEFDLDEDIDTFSDSKEEEKPFYKEENFPTINDSVSSSSSPLDFNNEYDRNSQESKTSSLTPSNNSYKSNDHYQQSSYSSSSEEEKEKGLIPTNRKNDENADNRINSNSEERSSVFDSLQTKRLQKPETTSSKESNSKETTASFLNRFLNSKKDELLVKEEQNKAPSDSYARSQTIGDKLKSQSQVPKIHENINGSKKIKLNEIPIHKQYQYVQKVFEGNNVRFRIIVDKVNNAQNKDEVESILDKFVLNNDKIDKQDSVVQEFLELLRNRF